MAVINAQMIKALRRTRSLYYDDLLVLRVASGVKDTGVPDMWTLPDGSVVPDAWSRVNTDPTRQGVVAQKILMSGNFSWLPTADRSFVEVGMVEGAEAVFTCSDQLFQVVSGSRTWAVMENTQLRVIRMSLARSTGEMILILGKTRDDF